MEGQKLSKFKPYMEIYMIYIDNVLVIWNGDEKVDEQANEFTLEQYGLKLKKDQVRRRCIIWICNYTCRREE